MVLVQYSIVVDYIISPVTYKRASFCKQKCYMPGPSLRHTMCFQQLSFFSLCHENEMAPGMQQIGAMASTWALG